ncbi:MAG: radical SAM family heme chaperone HemW [Fibromonadaceae bacterium]|jgi:oxygen-independent coproporphyrinogen-3 oxidase|nr:radical SAM family heme chaperone HemW [Fibromonadaceae bacterium]
MRNAKIYITLMSSLYMHIPFCVSICDYCDFSAIAAPERLHEEYVGLVLRELELREGLKNLETVYLGGGSPSALSIKNLRCLLVGLQKQDLKIDELKEYSMEWNPEEVNDEKIQLALDFGINRFSLGVQSLNDSLLKMLGRRHSAKTALAAFDKLNHAFSTGSADLMFCLPNQSTEDFLSDVKSFVSLGAKHISFYGMTLENHSSLQQQIRKKKILSPPEDLYPEMYLCAAEILESAGMERYEISNFAKPGHESKHNSVYWQRKPYMGAGPSAHSYLQGIRYSTPRNYLPWARWVKNGCPKSGLTQDIPSEKGREIEAVWLALRTREGLSLSGYEHEFGKKFSLEKAEPFIKKQWLTINEGRLQLKTSGLLWLDKIILKIL